MKIVYAPGCFDLLHVGHLRFLERARLLGDRLIVGVAADSVIALDKGRSPVIPEDQRLELVRGLACVSEAVIYRELRFLKEIRKFKPHILAVGEQWGSMERHLEASNWMKQHGGMLATIDYTREVSTTMIFERIVDRANRSRRA
jgi:rfaE bifunctional protein nucleotidyltransferase chain/domain